MSDVEILNAHIELLFELWDGKITEEEYEHRRLLYISEEVDREMQKDSFY